MKLHRPSTILALILTLAVVLTACSKKTSTTTGSSQTPTAAPTLSATSFTSDFSAMSQLTGLAASGNEWVSLHRNFDPSEVEAPELTCNGTSEISMRNQYRAWARYMTLTM